MNHPHNSQYLLDSSLHENEVAATFIENIIHHIEAQYDYRPTLDGDFTKDQLFSRLDRSDSAIIVCQPMIADGLYTVSTFDTDSDAVSKNVVDIYSRRGDRWHPSCTCSDYTYRCASTGLECKHILAVKKQVSNGILKCGGEKIETWYRDFFDRYCEAVDDSFGSDECSYELNISGGEFEIKIETHNGSIDGNVIVTITSDINADISAYPPTSTFIYLQLLLIYQKMTDNVNEIFSRCGCKLTVENHTGER